MEEPMEIARQKLEHLKKLLENLEQNKAGALQTFHDLFQLTHEGRDLLADTADWLNKTARLFLSPKLRDILVKHSLEVYCFHLAALYLTDVDDILDDFSNNGEILKGIGSFPAGAYNKLKRELLGSHPQNFQNQPMMDRQLESQVKNLSLTSEINESEAITPPPIIQKPQSLAEKLLPHCRSVGKNIIGKELYLLPLTKNAQSRSSKTDGWMFGSPSLTKVKSKTILLMGGTGSGKTTLINAMLNYILGVEWDDPFRFILISEEGTSSLPHSQTTKVSTYELHHQGGFKIPFSLIIVDTPGYGDDKNGFDYVERDCETTDSIQQFFKDDKGIQVLDAVGFTVQADASFRLTPTQRYIFDSILSIFGNDVRNNLRFLVTFADGQTPPVLQAIKRDDFSYQLDAKGQPCHHLFNNDDGDLGTMFWKLSMENFESFFSGLSFMETRTLTLTNEVLEERKRINVTIQGLTLKQKQMFKMEELQKTKQMIETPKDEISNSAKYEEAVQKEMSAEGSLESELDQIKCDFLSDIDTIIACLRHLNHIALLPDAFINTEPISLMMQAEFEEKNPGFLERLESLTLLLDKMTE